MCSLQNQSGSISDSEIFSENRDIGAGNQDDKILIRQANTANLEEIFRYYQIEINEFNRKICCPFPDHNDKNPSFYFYKDTNSFYCYSCNRGGNPVNFVSIMENVEKKDAALKIINNFYVDNSISKSNIFSERQFLYSEFSNLIRNFIFSHKNDNLAIVYIERITLIFDTILDKHNIDNIGLKSLIDKLKIKITQYKEKL